MRRSPFEGDSPLGDAPTSSLRLRAGPVGSRHLKFAPLSTRIDFHPTSTRFPR
eukprot:CAMPEP_0171946112 /NCGR_PEP_ID=MMETSP0993-20121228/51396_1 /TAXON_ID=483369 /ORGANISM="non described non described, Strain CCMP2098" /LENGTH=52 /DNA_ID=CAMNT_0012589363 /DNA_START=201 /DNA_END=356 /DNA_ORIENTATION=-